MFTFIKKLFQCFFVWRISGGGIYEVDVIVVHAGGVNGPSGPNPINRYLADLVCQIHEKSRLPIIAQGEVLKELKRRIDSSYFYGNIPTQKFLKDKGLPYLDTIGVWLRVNVTLKENGWRRPLLVAPQPVMLRALLTGRKMGIDVIPHDIPRIVWDPTNEQKWMRGPWRNIPRELAGRLLWLFQGKL